MRHCVDIRRGRILFSVVGVGVQTSLELPGNGVDFLLKEIITMEV